MGTDQGRAGGMDRLREMVSRNWGRLFGPRRKWHQDLCDYYGVSPEEALALGRRAYGRRPDLPGSATTRPVRGQSFEELWAARPRRTPAEIMAFYQDIGAWSAFRQVVRHRRSRFDFLKPHLGPDLRFCEYGAGVAPVTFWMVERLRRPPRQITIVDLPSEHFTFGQWRTRRLIAEKKAEVNLQALEVRPDRLPLGGFYDLITILEVFEHLHNPLEVAVHLDQHLACGGILWENYHLDDNPQAADLKAAQVQRPHVFDYLRRHFELIRGQDPEAPRGGGTRCWRKMEAGAWA
ncbi:MAG: class I SAM-dependent methyltransferase [Deltaproteobacteria bacterium]|nr:class I SAM-dependent methyltransferase [Deltaproteobacteria bacterium]